MELFIPSLLVLILGALFGFVLLPKLSPYVLGVLAIAMFILGIWQHYMMFPYEYRSSVATEILKEYEKIELLDIKKYLDAKNYRTIDKDSRLISSVFEKEIKESY